MIILSMNEYDLICFNFFNFVIVWTSKVRFSLVSAMSNTFWSLICFTNIAIATGIFITVIINVKLNSMAKFNNSAPRVGTKCLLRVWINDFKFLFFREREYKCFSIYIPFRSRIKFNTRISTKFFSMFTFNNIKYILYVFASCIICSPIKSVLTGFIKFLKSNFLSIEPWLNYLKLSLQID